MVSTSRVVFVGHDASLTGAPMVLLSFLRWLGTTSGEVPRAVLLRGGPLEGRYRDVAEVARLDGALERRFDQVSGVLVGAHRPAHRRRTRAAVRAATPSAVIANTLVAGRAVLEAGVRAPIICHVHELDGVAERVLGGAPERLVDSVQGFVAAGDAVASMLIDRWRVPSNRVRVVEEFIDPPSITLSGGDRGGSTPLVVGVGGAGARKGLTTFVDLLAVLNRGDRVVRGLWIGVDRVAGAEVGLWIDSSRASGRLELLGPVPDPSPWVAQADLLVSTSLEDPFPLVALEAGALGVPVAGFDSGGLRELLHRSGNLAHLVAVGDVIQLARVCRRLLDNDVARASSGARLRDAVVGGNLTERLAPELWSAVGDLVGR